MEEKLQNEKVSTAKKQMKIYLREDVSRLLELEKIKRSTNGKVATMSQTIEDALNEYFNRDISLRTADAIAPIAEQVKELKETVNLQTALINKLYRILSYQTYLSLEGYDIVKDSRGWKHVVASDEKKNTAIRKSQKDYNSIRNGEFELEEFLEPIDTEIYTNDTEDVEVTTDDNVLPQTEEAIKRNTRIAGLFKGGR